MKKVLLIFLIVILCWGSLGAQTQYTISDSVIFWKDTHVDWILYSWDRAVVFLYKNQVFQDSTVLVEVATGRFAVSHAPLSKGIYVIDYECWLDDYPTGIPEVISVVDPADFKYSGTGCNPPTGANTIYITVKDSSNDTPISQCMIQIWDLAETEAIWWGYTNSSGGASFMYDNDTLLVKLMKNPIAFTIPETLFIDGNEDTTYYGYSYDIPPGMVRVEGKVQDLGALPDTTINITAEVKKAYLWYNLTLLSPYKKSTNPDTTGYWSMYLYPNSSLTPTGTQYHFEVKDKNDRHLIFVSDKPGVSVTLPDTGSVWKFNF